MSKKQTKEPQSFPTSEQLEKELSRQKKKKFGWLRIFVILLVVWAITVVAVAVVTHYWLPVLRVYGMSMAPTLSNGQVVVAVKTNELKQGDICIFSYDERRLLCKRVIGLPGDVVDIKEDGQVTVNGQPLEESYVTMRARGECEVPFPCTVPEGSYFVLGDNRTLSIDSRQVEIGCVSAEKVDSKLIFRLWPMQDIGKIE